MKKFIIYILLFATSFLVLQVLSGLFLTLIYSPDLSSSWHMESFSSSKTLFGDSASISSLIIAMISAVIAYSLTSLFQKSDKVKKGAH